jgi:hypothetical protein
MRLKGNLAWLLLAAASLSLAVGGCGNGGSDTSGVSSTSSDSSQPTATTKSPESNSAGSEPSREFLSSGTNGGLAKIGHESSAAEREAASAVLEKSFEAREIGDWATQCSTLASSTIEQLEKNSAVLGGTVSCPKVLKAQAAPVPPTELANTLTGPIDAFRINEGINGFAFFHGTGGKDFVIPLIKEGGEWKLVLPVEQEIP